MTKRLQLQVRLAKLDIRKQLEEDRVEWEYDLQCGLKDAMASAVQTTTKDICDYATWREIYGQDGLGCERCRWAIRFINKNGRSPWDDDELEEFVKLAVRKWWKDRTTAGECGPSLAKAVRAELAGIQDSRNIARVMEEEWKNQKELLCNDQSTKGGGIVEDDKDTEGKGVDNDVRADTGKV
jgi:hypothetical protein